MKTFLKDYLQSPAALADLAKLLSFERSSWVPVGPDVDRAVGWSKNNPVVSSGGWTTVQLVVRGDGDDLPVVRFRRDRGRFVVTDLGGAVLELRLRTGLASTAHVIDGMDTGTHIRSCCERASTPRLKVGLVQHDLKAFAEFTKPHGLQDYPAEADLPEAIARVTLAACYVVDLAASFAAKLVEEKRSCG